MPEFSAAALGATTNTTARLITGPVSTCGSATTDMVSASSATRRSLARELAAVWAGAEGGDGLFDEACEKLCGQNLAGLLTKSAKTANICGLTTQGGAVGSSLGS